MEKDEIIKIARSPLALHKDYGRFIPASFSEKKNWIYNEKVWNDEKSEKLKSKKIFEDFEKSFPLIFEQNKYSGKKSDKVIFQEIIRPVKVFKNNPKLARFLYVVNDNLREGFPGVDMDFDNEEYLNSIKRSDIYSVQKSSVKSEKFAQEISFYDIRMKNDLESYFCVRIPDITREVKIKSTSKTYENVFSEDYWYEGLEKELIEE